MLLFLESVRSIGPCFGALTKTIVLSIAESVGCLRLLEMVKRCLLVSVLEMVFSFLIVDGQFRWFPLLASVSHGLCPKQDIAAAQMSWPRCEKERNGLCTYTAVMRRGW